MRLAEAIIATARELSAAGLVLGTTGNVSARRGSRMLITPTRTRYADLTPERLVAVGPDGIPCSPGVPSIELRTHLSVYLARPDVGAIVHTHSLYATAWGLRGAPLTGLDEDFAYYGIDRVDVVPSLPPGSERLAERAPVGLGQGRAVLLAGHGVLAVGADPDEARVIAAIVERQAHLHTLLGLLPVARHARLPAVLPTVTEGRGRHVTMLQPCAADAARVDREVEVA